MKPNRSILLITGGYALAMCVYVFGALWWWVFFDLSERAVKAVTLSAVMGIAICAACLFAAFWIFPEE